MIRLAAAAAVARHHHHGEMPMNPADTILDTLATDLPAAATAFRYAALLPAAHIPLPWLQELAASHHPELRGRLDLWDAVVSRLFALELLLRKEGFPEVARADEQAAQRIRCSLGEQQARALRDELHAFCAGRLREARAEKARLFNQVLTGDPEIEVTAWTVPSVDVVRARAAGSDRVAVDDFGDGTYALRLVGKAAWEEESLKAFIAQEFAADELDAVEWALRTEAVSADDLTKAEVRVGEVHVRNPESASAARVAGLYWLGRAHAWYGQGGSSQSAYHLAGKAVEILRRLKDQNPGDTDAAELLANAELAAWAYVD
jgi:hypothetical protein